MHHQSLIALPFITSRYAGDTAELLSPMTSTYLREIWEALDLRELHLEFVKVARRKVDNITRQLLQQSEMSDLQVRSSARLLTNHISILENTSFSPFFLASTIWPLLYIPVYQQMKIQHMLFNSFFYATFCWTSSKIILSVYSLKPLKS